MLIIDRGRLIASDTPENLEKQMADASGMELLIKGEEKQIREILDTLPQAADVNVLDSREELVKKVTFRMNAAKEDGTDIREAIFLLLQNRDYPFFPCM